MTDKLQQNAQEKQNRLMLIVEEHPYIFIGLCFILPVALLQITYWIIHYFDITLFLEPLSASDLLLFFGSILGGLIGGLIALYVLRETIHNERDMIKEQQKLSIMPRLLYTITEQDIVPYTDNRNSINIFHPFFRKTCPEKSIRLNLQIHNIGLGPAVLFDLDGWIYNDIDLMTTNRIEAIPKDEKVNLQFEIILPTYENYKEIVGQNEKFSCSIKYEDVLGNQYQQEVKFVFARLKYYDNDEYVEEEKIYINEVFLPETKRKRSKVENDERKWWEFWKQKSKKESK